MSYFTETMGNLLHQTAFFNLTWGNFVMILVACIFLYLAIAKGFEPLLLVQSLWYASGKHLSGYLCSSGADE